MVKSAVDIRPGFFYHLSVHFFADSSLDLGLCFVFSFPIPFSLFLSPPPHPCVAVFCLSPSFLLFVLPILSFPLHHCFKLPFSACLRFCLSLAFHLPHSLSLSLSPFCLTPPRLFLSFRPSLFGFSLLVIYLFFILSVFSFVLTYVKHINILEQSLSRTCVLVFPQQASGRFICVCVCMSVRRVCACVYVHAC